MFVDIDNVKAFFMKKNKFFKNVFGTTAQVNFNSREIQKAFEKVKEKKKELTQLAKIDKNKLNICISV